MSIIYLIHHGEKTDRQEKPKLKWRKLSRKKIFGIVALSALVIIGASGVYSLLNPTLRLTASVVKASFQVGEPVIITIALQNIGLWPITFSYHQPLFDYIVYDEAGEKIFRFGDIAVIELWVKPVTLWPTQTITRTLTWDQEGYREEEGTLYKVPEGTYTIVAQTTVIYRNREFLLETQPIMVTIE